ncbi:MAG: NAD(P)-dependent oxidoreductase [Planctomycetaceae bacterium]
MGSDDTIGLIGLGLLGSALSERLIDGGFSVLGFDLDAQRCDELVKRGGRIADEVTDMARECSHILLSLPDSSISASVIEHLRPHLRPDAIIIDTTTGSPTEMRQLGEQLAEQGVGYLDATVGGSSMQARDGEALIMVGGDNAHVAACQGILNALGRKTMHVGPSGSGSADEARRQSGPWSQPGRACRGLVRQSHWRRSRQSSEVLKASPAYSTVMDTKGEKMLTGDFAAQARLRQHLKDVRLILESAAASGATTPLSEWHAEALQALVDQGHGDDDNSSIIRAFE